MYHQPTHGKNMKASILRIAMFLLLAVLYIGVPVQSIASTLLPNGKQTFTNQNGTPLAAGKVYFYVPGTTTPKNTYQDSGNSVANANPVVLDSAGRAVIYGTGCYRQIVQTAASATIWDQTTCDTSQGQASWGGTAGGTPNAITVTADNFTGADGQVIRFIASATNSGATTINPSSFGAVSIVVDGGAGPIACRGGEITQNNVVTLVYDATSGVFHLSTLTSVTAGAGLSTSGVGASGGTGAVAVTLTSVQPVNNQTGTSYTLLNTDNAKLITFSNTSAVAVTIPSPTLNFAAGFWADIMNLSTGIVTLIPASGTINGALSTTLSLGGHGRLVSDGTNWYLAGSGNTASSAAAAYSNLKVINAPGNENTHITITASYLGLRNSSGFSFAVQNVNVTCNFTTTGANGLDAGSLANTTWYFYYVISNGTTTACLGSTSATSPTLPSGYVFTKRIGAGRTNGSAQLYRVIQYNSRSQYIVGTNPSTPIFMDSGVKGNSAGPVWQAIAVANFVPTTASRVIGYIAAMNQPSAVVIAAPNNSYGTFTSTTNPPPILLNTTTASAELQFDFMLESTNIYWISSTANGSIPVMGWEDNL